MKSIILKFIGISLCLPALAGKVEKAKKETPKYSIISKSLALEILKKMPGAYSYRVAFPKTIETQTPLGTGAMLVEVEKSNEAPQVSCGVHGYDVDIHFYFSITPTLSFSRPQANVTFFVNSFGDSLKIETGIKSTRQPVRYTYTVKGKSRSCRPYIDNGPSNSEKAIEAFLNFISKLIPFPGC